MEIEGKPKEHSEKEVIDYLVCLDWITEELLEHLENLHTEEEQYFGECSVLGADRTSLKEQTKKLLENNRKRLIKKVEKYQKIKVVKGDKNE